MLQRHKCISNMPPSHRWRASIDSGMGRPGRRVRLRAVRHNRSALSISKNPTMHQDKAVSGPRKLFGDVAPKLAELSEDVLFGDIWERPQLSKRDRSLITCAALVTAGEPEQMNFHFPRALENGVRKEELIELITRLAFYAGWPNAMVAVAKAKELFGTAAT